MYKYIYIYIYPLGGLTCPPRDGEIYFICYYNMNLYYITVSFQNFKFVFAA